MILPSTYRFTPIEWPWQNFTPSEMACRHCGEQFYWPEFLDALQSLRECAGRPLRINSAHRCSLNNVRLGGAPLSQHLRLAVDIDLHGHERLDLAKQARTHGFTGLGYYQTFLHLDMGRRRHWFGKGAQSLWV